VQVRWEVSVERLPVLLGRHVVNCASHGLLPWELEEGSRNGRHFTAFLSQVLLVKGHKTVIGGDSTSLVANYSAFALKVVSVFNPRKSALR
jgi:hypothetical protein